MTKKVYLISPVYQNENRTQNGKGTAQSVLDQDKLRKVLLI